MRILLLCPRVPFPPHDGGAIAMYDVATGLARAGHQVTVLAVNTPKHRQDDPNCLGPGVRLLTAFIDTTVRPLPALRSLLLGGPVPYNVARFDAPAFRDRLTQLLQAETFDIIQLEGTFVAPYVTDIRRLAPQTPLVLRAHNVEGQIWARLAQHEANPLKAWYKGHLAQGLRRFEALVAKQVDAVAAITELDRQQWAALAGGSEEGGVRSEEPEARSQESAVGATSIRPLTQEEPGTGNQEPEARSHELQNTTHKTLNTKPETRTVAIAAGVETARWAPDGPLAGPPQPRAVALLGSLNWEPNLEGVRWLLERVWPAVRAAVPDLTLHIAGSHPPAWLFDLRAPGVTVHGFVPDAAAWLRQFPALLVPLLSGGGMRIKIVEAMTLGRCVVTTPVGGEGIEAIAGQEWLVAETAETWVRTLTSLFTPGGTDPYAIGRAAAALAHRAFGNEQVIRRFEALYHQLGAIRPQTAPATRATGT